MSTLRALLAVAALTLGACASSSPVERAGPVSTTSAPPRSSPSPSTTTTTLPVAERPDWLGTRVLPLRPDGLGEIQPTPPELVDRRFATIDILPPPDDDRFTVEVDVPTDEVLARSTWTTSCPVDATDLRYVTLPFWGFDGLAHTGELLVHADAVEAVAAGFASLHERRFPIEEM